MHFLILVNLKGAIGVLDRTQMDHFATIFVDYQKRGKSQDPDGRYTYVGHYNTDHS